MEAEGETGGSADASEKDEEVVFCGVRLPRKRIVEGFWQRRLKRPKVVDLTEDGEVDTGRTTWCSPPRSPGRTARPPNPAQSSERATPTHPPASRPPASLRSATSQVTSPQLTSSDSQQPVAKDTPHSSPSSVQEDWRSKLPPLPATPLLQQPLPPAAAGTNAPQQVELTVARIRNPKGIGALWRVERPDPRTAKVRQYHLYALHEDRTGRVSSWRNVGTVPSLPLPMACKLTDHGPGRRFCFTVISEDVYGRYGPYSQIQSIVPQD
ncbi:hypothetical protein JZ751_006308 [Albula glossodonta]|uniref:Activating transcription factor 7-interacting protein Fn3 domain-containing protein n=1 Tax=Albula glossodonta TaxID=121402 RepID=A0A8T2N8D4_9TELE|nr:hypothetical protein JZ751_009081 [Albula glossodonta]KAG9334911.1 hypothetical protein JZ751_006308 [Albula glossodonta]